MQTTQTHLMGLCKDRHTTFTDKCKCHDTQSYRDNIVPIEKIDAFSAESINFSHVFFSTESETLSA